MTDLRLDGRSALVTGASRGIGRAIAAAFAAAGADVVLSSRKPEALEEAAATMGPRATTFAANAGDPDQAAACVDATMQRHGRFDILVNNAATNPYFGPTIDIDLARYDKTFQVNLRGPLVWTQAAWRAWMQDHGGVVLNIASVGGLRGERGLGIYNVTKAALIHLTKTLAVELAPGVRVNALAPGLVKTEFARAPSGSQPKPPPRHMRPCNASACPTTSRTPLSSWPATPAPGSPATPSSSTAARSCAPAWGSARVTTRPPGGQPGRVAHRPAPVTPRRALAWPRTPAGRAAVAVGIALDVGLAIDAFVIRPVTATPPDPKALLRTLLVGGVAVVAVAHRRRDATTPNQPTASPRDPAAWVASLAAGQPPGGPTPLAAHVSDVLEVFWDGPPGPAPLPWQASPSGWVWEAPTTSLPRPRAARPLPTLVELGRTATGALWLHLGAFRRIAVIGASDEATQLVQHLRDRLAAPAAAGALDTATLRGPLDDRGDARDLDELLAVLWRRAARRPRRRTARHARPEPVAPLVVAVPRGASPDTIGRLVDATIGASDVTLLVVGDVRAADLRLTCRDGRVEVSCLGGVAVAPHPPAPAAPPAVSVPAPIHAAEPTPPTAGRVEVRVLGPVEVHGAPGPRRGKCLELVAYLACHPDGVGDDQIRAALWPDRAPTAATWSNRVSVARKALGVDAAGEPHLRRFRRHVGRLGPGVGTDVAALEATLNGAATAPPAAAAAALTAGLTGVRGRPFDTADYTWVEREGHVTRCEQVVIDAAHRLTELALAAHDPRRAPSGRPPEASTPARRARRCAPTSRGPRRDREPRARRPPVRRPIPDPPRRAATPRHGACRVPPPPPEEDPCTGLSSPASSPTASTPVRRRTACPAPASCNDSSTGPPKSVYGAAWPPC